MSNRIAVLGDPSSHGGVIVTANQEDNFFKVGGSLVALDQAQHSCPIGGHGVTRIRAITVRSYHNGRLILTTNAVAECGALITPPDRGVTVE